MAGTIHVDNTNGTGGDVKATKAMLNAAPATIRVLDPSPIPTGSDRFYTVPDGTYIVSIAFAPGAPTVFNPVVVNGGQTDVVLP